MITRPIHSSGETIPAIGLGTWQTFDVGESTAERKKPLEDVIVHVRGMGRNAGRFLADVWPLRERGGRDRRQIKNPRPFVSRDQSMDQRTTDGRRANERIDGENARSHARPHASPQSRRQ